MSDEPTPPPVVRVREVEGELMVFSVASFDKRYPLKRYRVDLLANVGTGMCSCKDWGTRRGPAVKRGEIIWTRQTTCIHLRAALHFHIALSLPAAARRLEGQK